MYLPFRTAFLAAAWAASLPRSPTWALTHAILNCLLVFLANSINSQTRLSFLLRPVMALIADRLSVNIVASMN